MAVRSMSYGCNGGASFRATGGGNIGCKSTVSVNYPYLAAYERFVGTHAEFGKIDVAVI
ncbi:hypothetical protein [Zhongshania marina]|uniref:hypothetical protein n=1 Tax=Zhongshania marina TaxID=2304603 RepID=UPI0013147B9E